MQDFYMTFNTEALWAQSSFRNMGYGFKIGTMKHVGWYLSAMSNFRFKGAFSTNVPGNYNPEVASKSYLDGLLGMSFRVWKPVTWQLGAGFGYRTFNYKSFYYDERHFHLKDEVEMGPMLATGFMFDMNGFLLSAEFVGFYDINHSKASGYQFKDLLSLGFKVGIGFSLQTSEGKRQLLEHYGYVLPETGTSVAPKSAPESAQSSNTATSVEMPSVQRSAADSSAQEKTVEQKPELATATADTTLKLDTLVTPTIQLPSVETGFPITITEYSAMAKGKIDYDGGELTERGFCFGKTADPGLGKAFCVKASNDGQKHFSATLDRLTPSTHYYVRAYATNAAGTAYGEQVEFTTKAEIPAVVTLNPEGMTATSALCGGEIHGEKYVGKTIVGRGICYDTVINPTVAANRTSDGSGTGKFTTTLSNLNPGTVYYVRAYVQHADGVDYGENQSFHTRAALNTTAAYNITDTSVMTGGYDLYDRGGVKVREKGVCCSYRPNPTVENYRVVTASWDVQNDSWKSVLDGLEPNTDFHIRAYVILDNDAVLYGNDQAFRTKPACGQFTVSDVDGNTYATVKVGSQCWLKENMRATRYADGAEVNPNGMVSPGWDSANVPVYGYLYDWPAAVRNITMSSESSERVQGLCPNGWHIPNKAEWQKMFDYVKAHPKWISGKSKNSIAKALSAQEKWEEGLGFYPNCHVCKDMTANNGTGFSALPAGYYGGDYESMTVSAYFWSSTCGQYGKELGPYSVSWGYDKSTVDMRPWLPDVGCSVRCLKD